MDYLFPCKPNSLPPDSEMFARLDNDETWIAEVKKNGWRALIMSDVKKEIWTRAKTLVKDDLPEIRRQLLTLPAGIILDGELISQRPKNWEKHFYLFDIIMFKGKLLTDLPLIERRKYLEEVHQQYLGWCKKIELSQWTRAGKKALFMRSIGDELLEGIVIKRLDSKYLVHPNKCPQNPKWLKVKKEDSQFVMPGRGLK